MSTLHAVRLPAAKQVRDLLSRLVEPEVTLRPSTPFGVGPHYRASLATYVDHHLVVRAVVVLDLPLSLHLGAARTLLPRSVVHTAMKDQAATPAIARGVTDVLRALAPVLAAGPDVALRPYGLHVSGDRLPELDRARTRCLGRREDLEVAVAGYGHGRLAVLLA